jgi:hypothetical protein
MKKFVAASTIMTAFLLYSCEPAATFDKPQPDNVKSLASFPEGIQGKYLSADQASIVTISDKLITRHYDFDFKKHKDSIGSSYKLVGDTLIEQTDGTKEKVVVKGDTIIQHVNSTDTLFNISANNVLKKFKGYYFLNNRYSDDAWEVKKLWLKKGGLTVGSISDKDDIQKLKDLTEATADTTSTQFTLTRRQFKKFVKQEGFSEQETFNRMTENGR